MLSQLSFVLLVTLVLGASNCVQADEFECLSSVCPNHYYFNSSCLLNASLACGSGQVNFNTTCKTCSGLPSSSCSTECPDYLFQAGGASAPSACTSCQTLFGQSCIRCTSSACLICAYSSNLALSSDGLSCFDANCTFSNCLICYQCKNKCYKCKTGFETDSNFACVAAICSITNCITCASTSSCGSCFSNYKLSSDLSACHPICTDVNCLECIAPGICGTCQPAYSPNALGKCIIDCAQIAVSNCASCVNFAICSSCNSGFQLASGGAACTATCAVTLCDICVAGDTTTCRKCQIGYDLNNSGKTCSLGVCYIANCQTCLSLSQCSACITGFTRSINNLTCTSNCPATFPNCLICSQSACTTCDIGYSINSVNGQCFLICSAITNCIRCTSTTQCASCAQNYQLSSDLKSCSLACKVEGCMTCSSASASTCSACNSAYTLDAGMGRCQKNCKEGQVNTATSGVTCQNCADLIGNCDFCATQGRSVTCTSSQAGYFLNGANIDKCSGAITNCLTCTNPYFCDSCAKGFKAVAGTCSNTTCNSAVANCYSCKSNALTVCHECNPGYTLNSASVCALITCSNSLVFDTSLNACACPLGTFLQGGSCHPCTDSNCYDCTLSTCSKCQIGFYPDGSTCQPCITNCRTCTSGYNCRRCEDKYSLTFNGDCVSFGGGNGGAAASAALVYPCGQGCIFCVIGFTSSFKVVCQVPHSGYSLVGGKPVRCDPNCQACKSYLPSLCTACFPKTALVSGQCVACRDANALTCSPLNVNYSLSCQQGFTSVYFSSATAAVNTTGGTCTACSDFCARCDSTGPGNCDAGQCNLGSVQLVNTTNCSLCFSGCVKCDKFNPNQCIDCGFRKYLDSTSGRCQACSTGCKTCTTNASNCQSCNEGYWLVNSKTCTLIPNNCLALNGSTSLCTGCFVAYTLNPGSTACENDLSCNSTFAGCEVCPNGYYLVSGRCYICNLVPNCVACSLTNASQCFTCSNGFYVNASNNCVACPSNCLTCDSVDFCTKATTGNYITLNIEHTYTGAVAICLSPCATCIDQNGFCLTCVSGYTLFGSSCRRNLYLIVVMIFGQSNTGPTIFRDSDKDVVQLSLSLRSFNLLGHNINSKTPPRFKDGRNWRKRQYFRKLRFGSVGVEMDVEAGGYTDGTEAANDYTNGLNSDNGNIGGARVLSSSVSPQGFSSQEGSGANLGLILGLAVPLSILLILIIMLMMYSNKKDQTDSGEEGKKAGFYTEGKLDKAEQI